MNRFNKSTSTLRHRGLSSGIRIVGLVVLSAHLGAPVAAAPPKYEWQLVTGSAAFAARDGAGALVYDDKMWLLGGWNPNNSTYFPKITNNEVWSSTDGETWNLVKANTFRDGVYNPATDWEGRHTAGYAVYDNKMWIVGGDVNQGHYQNDVWNSTDGVSWTHVNEGNPVPWGPRALHYTLVHDDKIWVIGGQTMPAFTVPPLAEEFYRDIWNTSDGVNWQQVQPEEPFWPQRGMIGGSVVFNGRMWILGGGTYDTPQTPTRKFFNDVWSSADGIHWTEHTESAPWAPRQYHDIAVFDGKMWVMEGYDGAGNRNDVWYSADGENWTEAPNTPWAPRHAASLYSYDNALWMVAGNNLQPDVWKLTIAPLPGDYDLDDDVDDDDFLTWQQTFGSTTELMADGNRNGIVDVADYTIWRDNYGAGVVTAEEPSSVPEPGSAILVGLGGLLFLVLR